LQGHFPRVSCGHNLARLLRKTFPGFALLCCLWSLRPFRRSLSSYSELQELNCMITSETRAQIHQWFFAEHWKIGTIAQALRIHPDTVRHAIESDRFHRAQTLRACLTDAYLPFLRRP
jgi:hypothetical protein